MNCHIRHIQKQIIGLVTPFCIRHKTLVFVAVLNNWEKELNEEKICALEMQSGVNSADRLEFENSNDIILNYGGNSVLSRDISPSVVIHSICDIAIGNINKSEIRNTNVS